MTSIRQGVVEFRFFRPDASGVSVTGDFNDWQAQRLVMERGESGWWTASARLPAGEYRFRYLADGRWYTDFASHGVEMDRIGWNSVLVVPGKKAKLMVA